MTAPATPPAAPDAAPSLPPRPAAVLALPDAAAGAGRTGWIAPDGMRIVVQLDKHDMAAEGSPTHVGIGCTAWEIDAAGAMVGSPIARWVHTVPIAVLARGDVTLAAIAEASQDEAITRLLAQQVVLTELDAFDLAATPTTPETVSGGAPIPTIN